MDRICKHCGFKRGEHKARTLHCPLSGGSFSQFHRTQVFEERTEREKKSARPRPRRLSTGLSRRYWSGMASTWIQCWKTCGRICSC